MTLTLLAADQPQPVAVWRQLILAAMAGIALITVAKLHPFLALIFGSLMVGSVAGENPEKVLESFTKGFGTTAASVGILIALGAMFAKLLADSGGADEIVDTIVGHASPRALPWAMALVGAIIGLPIFFEIGLVLLMPVIYLVARRSQLSLITVGIPALAGLSAMHGLVPPHPGPLVAIANLNADPRHHPGARRGGGDTDRYRRGPAVRKAGRPPGRARGTGQVFLRGVWTRRRSQSRRVRQQAATAPVRHHVGNRAAAGGSDDGQGARQHLHRRRGSACPSRFNVLGTPLVALLIAVVVAMFTFGLGVGMSKGEVAKCVESGLPPVAGIILIVAAGGGFKQILVDTGIGTMLADWAKGAHISVLLLAWLIAVLIRLATGSATVATVTASSLMLGLVEDMSSGQVALVVLAVGAGSLFFSHVNDARFWLVKEYFGMTVGQTIKTWSVMETVLSVVGLVLLLLLDLVI